MRRALGAIFVVFEAGPVRQLFASSTRNRRTNADEHGRLGGHRAASQTRIVMQKTAWLSGGGGIRTLGALARPTVFKTGLERPSHAVCASCATLCATVASSVAVVFFLRARPRPGHADRK